MEKHLFMFIIKTAKSVNPIYIYLDEKKANCFG